MLDLILSIISSCHFTASNFKITQPFKKSHILLYKKSFDLSTICRLTLNAIHGKIIKERIDCVTDILVAVYNGEKYLRNQLDSIMNQTNKEFNIIIRDDGSTDGSLDIIKEFKSLYPEKVKIVEGNPSKSAKNNFFELMNHSESEYVMFCDQDDIWLENKLELTLIKMKSAEKLSGDDMPILCHTDLTVVDQDLNTIHPSFYKMQKFNISKTSLNRALVQNIVTGCTVMINKPLLDIAKNTNSEGVIMHDWWLFLIASVFGKIEALNTPTILYRQHGANQLGAQNPSEISYYTKRLKAGSTLHLTYIQAESFYNAFEEKLSKAQKHIVKEYINLPKKNKLQKISSIIKNDFWKHSAIKKAGQIILV